ncbi:MAG: glutamate synthase-related protein [Candidatus Hydrothermarchaeota archaeon]
MSSLPEFKINIDREICNVCRRCIRECSFDVLRYDEEKNKIISDDALCVACQRCMEKCPTKAITIDKRPIAFSSHPTWTEEIRRDILAQAETGSAILVSTGCEVRYPSIFDHLLIDACQVTNPAIDPLREPMELTTFIGKKPKMLELREENEEIELMTEITPNLEIKTPITIAHMSYGALSLNAHKSLARGAKMVGTVMGTGEGGLHKDLYPLADSIVVQVASGRFGVHREYLNIAAGIEIKIGQGAKPGIGGHLPGRKVSEAISETRMIPTGTDALSPAPHHDIYSIEDLSRLIYALKEATRYEKPVFVKIAAVHNSAPIASGIVRAGADAVVLDGNMGGTGASPKVIRDHLGIPIEIAIAVVDERLREEGIRNEASIIASGGIRSAADVAKAIALGADAVAIGTAALIALGCRVCKRCFTGKCSWGIATQDPNLVKRLDPEIGAQRVANLINAWSIELKEILGALGLNSIESLRGNRERLRGIGLDHTMLEILDVEPVGR